MGTTNQKSQINRNYHLRLPKYFQTPTNLLQRVYEKQVVLESIFTRGLTIYGTVRVNNCSWQKKIFVRFTVDQWKTFSIVNAYHAIYYQDSNTDVFQFKLTITKESSARFPTSLSFAICYNVNGQEFWDNNYSRNYILEIEESPCDDTSSALNQLSSRKSVGYDDSFNSEIAQDYCAIPSTSQQAGNRCGLKNLGGTCYMNSILQSLSFTSLLTNYFLYNNNMSTEYTIVSKEIIASEFLNLLYLLHCGKYSVLTPKPFKQILGHVKYAYLENQQQDAHEFLLVLLDFLHNDLIREKSNAENQAMIRNTVNQIDNNSIIMDLFYGVYKSTITCLQCKHTSCNFESFICLTLPIPTTGQCTLEDCLSYLNEDEYLMDDSRWFCPQCQQLCNAKKQLQIDKLPKILIIQLKRFQINSEMKWIKNDTLVNYPEGNLNLNQCCSSSSQGRLYTLYSVINHHGSLDDGHYITFCRDLSFNESQWFQYDDDMIRCLHPDEIHSNSKAYLLFYIVKETLE